MKVILNTDVKHLGEEGDVKMVADGYARNYLLPRVLAVPYNDATVAIFEGRKAEIEARKEQKRKDSASLKEKLEQLSLEAVMPASPNGKLYGAVSSLTVVDLFAKAGYEIERKRIEVPGVNIKSTGKYHVVVKLYEAQTATVELVVKAQEEDVSADKKAKGKKAEVAEAPAEEKEAGVAEEKAE